jgi:hypothetical protein
MGAGLEDWATMVDANHNPGQQPHANHCARCYPRQSPQGLACLLDLDLGDVDLHPLLLRPILHATA